MTAYRLDDATPQLPEEGCYWIAPTAAVIGRVILEAGASVWFGAVLRGDTETIVVGGNSNIQDNSVLHTDPGSPLVIGDNVTVGHRAILHGCTVGDGSLIGMGATVLDGARVGKRCLVGANSLITSGKVFADDSLIVGSPARAVRLLSEEEAARLALSADGYAANWKRFARNLEPL